MDRERLLAGAAIAALLTLGAGTAVVAQGGETEAEEGGEPAESSIGSSARREAADAALRATGGGRVLEVERGDDPGAAYEVEVRNTDGGVAEVLLDRDLDVVGRESGD